MVKLLIWMCNKCRVGLPCLFITDAPCPPKLCPYDDATHEDADPKLIGEVEFDRRKLLEKKFAELNVSLSFTDYGEVQKVLVKNDI